MAGRNRLENDGATALAEAFGVSGFCPPCLARRQSWLCLPALGLSFETLGEPLRRCLTHHHRWTAAAPSPVLFEKGVRLPQAVSDICQAQKRMWWVVPERCESASLASSGQGTDLHLRQGGRLEQWPRCWMKHSRVSSSPPVPFQLCHLPPTQGTAESLVVSFVRGPHLLP